jgi:hypothetical protein
VIKAAEWRLLVARARFYSLTAVSSTPAYNFTCLLHSDTHTSMPVHTRQYDLTYHL